MGELDWWLIWSFAWAIVGAIVFIIGTSRKNRRE